MAPRAIVVVLAATLTLASCGGGAGPNAGDAGRPSALASQRQRLTASATEALRHPPDLAGVYAGRTSRGRRALVRVSSRQRVGFSIVAACRRHPLRAFPDSPPRLRPDGSFRYRERGRAYRLRVAGRVLGRAAAGSLALSGRPRRGAPCRIRVAWRALRR
jgi:hypothetical protein